MTVNSASPKTVGMPARRPVATFSVTPAGSAPALSLQLIGGVPPADASTAPYAVDASAAGRVDVEMIRGRGCVVAVEDCEPPEQPADVAITHTINAITAERWSFFTPGVSGISIVTQALTKSKPSGLVNIQLIQCGALVLTTVEQSWNVDKSQSGAEF